MGLGMIRCCNCGVMHPPAEMLRDPHDGQYECVHCPGENWLRRYYGEAAADELVQLRAMRFPRHIAEELVRALRLKYPEQPGYILAGKRRHAAKDARERVA